MLTPYATAYRYPEEDWNEPDKDEISDAIAGAEKLYSFTLSVLPKKVHP